MRLHFRKMKPRDVAGAVEFVSSLPFERQRYGSALEHLPSIWSQLLRNDCLKAGVVEDFSRPACGFSALMVTAFIDDDFLQRCQNVPMFWIGPEIIRRIREGHSPVLSAEAIRAGNSGDGLNLLAWICFTPDAIDPEGALMNRLFMDAFQQEHCGFRIKEILTQDVDPRNARVAMNAGNFLWDPLCQRYDPNVNGKDIESITQTPFLIGVSRALALEHLGRWTSLLFAWSRPEAGFSPGQQRLLAAALQGTKDEELSRELTVAPSTVKHTWRAIFNRTKRLLPDLLPDDSEESLSHEGQRGREKRQRVLNYLRKHPEELRPFDYRMRPAGEQVTVRAPQKR